MTNSGKIDVLKRNILDIFNKVKGDRKLKITLMTSSVCIVLLAIAFSSSKETGYTELASIVSVQGEENYRVLREVSDIKYTVDEGLKIEIPIYALDVEGKELAVFRTKDEAEKLLDDIIKQYIGDEESKIEDVSFKEDINIVERLGTTSELQEKGKYEKAFYYITKGTNETKLYKVEEGENFWVIAEKYNINVDNLLKANPKIKPEKIQIGQEISLVVPKPLITVITKEVKDYTETIAYETEYEETNVLYKGEYKVKKEGQQGEKDIKAEIYKENGIETNRNILEEKITSEPTTKVVLKGTKNPPPRIGTGSFAKPTSRGVLTSPFGMRWGRRHTGIDIGLPVGSDVKAADGGKVIFSGTKGGYGKCIIIDHGANKKTLYAHNSKLLVSKGDKVFKGQIIAKSGNTGNSTGPHLHFEVRINDIPVNPSKYVKY